MYKVPGFLLISPLCGCEYVVIPSVSLCVYVHVHTCMCTCVSALGGQKMVMECDGELSFGRVNDEKE